MSKDIFYTFAPINWLLRITALSNIYRKGSHLAESGSILKSIIYVTSFGFFNIFYMYHKMKKIQGNRETGFVTFNDNVQIAYWVPYAEYVIDIFFVYKYSRVLLLKYFKAYNHIDAILGISSYNEIRRTIINSVVISFVICNCTSLFDYVTWVNLEGWTSATIYSIDYLYFFLTMLTILDIISHVIQVEFRLRMICELLQNCNTINFLEPGTDIKDKIRSISVEDNINKPLNSLKMLYYMKYLETAWFSRCYLLMLDQVAYLNISYGFRVLLYCVNLLINTINLLNLAIRIVNGTMQVTYAYGLLIYVPSICSTLRALNYGVMVVILMYRCEQVYKQNDRILETIDMLLASKINYSDLKNNLLEFRNLLITRPIKFHAAKFFSMDYTLLVSLTSVVVTYTIIMLQSMK